MKLPFGKRLSSSDLAIVIVVIAGYVVMFSIPLAHLDPQRIVLMLGLGILYLVLAIRGYRYACCRNSRAWVWSYFLVQLALGGVINYLGWGYGWLVLLPLVGQAVSTLEPFGAWLINGLVLVVSIFPFATRMALGDILINSVSMIAAIFFVAIFTQITASEQAAREEKERLATELEEANRKLVAYAAQVEGLAVAQERNRLAREIHDGLGHYLTSINMQIKAAQAILAQDPSQALTVLKKAQTLSEEALADVRRSVAALRQSPFDSRPLTEIVAGLVEECRASGIDTRLDLNGSPRPLLPQVELALFRAAQEGLTNVRKHARATCATVLLDYSAADAVRIAVQDNGEGAVQDEGGFGLLGLRERAQLLGGQVNTVTEPGQGFTLEVIIPVSNGRDEYAAH